MVTSHPLALESTKSSKLIIILLLGLRSMILLALGQISHNLICKPKLGPRFGCSDLFYS